jgi:hypothetical protein
MDQAGAAASSTPTTEVTEKDFCFTAKVPVPEWLRMDVPAADSEE